MRGAFAGQGAAASGTLAVRCRTTTVTAVATITKATIATFVVMRIDVRSRTRADGALFPEGLSHAAGETPEKEAAVIATCALAKTGERTADPTHDPD